MLFWRSPALILLLLFTILISSSCHGAFHQQIANMTQGQNIQAITWVERFNSKGNVQLEFSLPKSPAGTEDQIAQIEKITIIAFEIRESTVFLSEELNKADLNFGGTNVLSFTANAGMKSAHFYLLVQFPAHQDQFRPQIDHPYTSQEWSLAITLPAYPDPKTSVVVTSTPQWFKTITSPTLPTQIPTPTLSLRTFIADQISSLVFGSSVSTRESMTVYKAQNIDIFGLNLAGLPSFHSSPADDIASKINKITMYIHGPGWLHSVRQSNPYLTKGATVGAFDADFASNQSPCHLNGVHSDGIYGDSLHFVTKSRQSPWVDDVTPLPQLLMTETMQFECLNAVFFTYKSFRDPKSEFYDPIIAKLPIFITIKGIGGSLNSKTITEFGVLNLQFDPTEDGGYQYTPVTPQTKLITPSLITPSNNLQQQKQAAATFPFIYNTTSYYHPPSYPFSSVGSLKIGFDLIFPTESYPIDEYMHNTNDHLTLSLVGTGLDGISTTTTKGQFTMVPTPLYYDPTALGAGTVVNNDSAQQQPTPHTSYVYNAILHDNLDFTPTSASPKEDKTKSLEIPLKKIFAMAGGTKSKEIYQRYSATGQMTVHCLVLIDANITSSLVPTETTAYPQLLINYFHSQQSSGGEHLGFSRISHPFTIAMEPVKSVSFGSLQTPQQLLLGPPLTSKFDTYIHSTHYLYISITNPVLLSLHRFHITFNSGHFLTTTPTKSRPEFSLLQSNPIVNATSINHLCMMTCKMDAGQDSKVQPAPCTFPQRPTLTYNHNTNTITVDNLTHYIKSDKESDAKPIYILRCNSKQSQLSPYTNIINPSTPPSSSSPHLNDHVSMTLRTELTHIAPPHLPQNITTVAHLHINTNKPDLVANLPPSFLGQPPRQQPLGPDDGLGPENDKSSDDDNKPRGIGFIVTAISSIIIILLVVLGTVMWKRQNQYGRGINPSSTADNKRRNGFDDCRGNLNGSQNSSLDYVALSDTDGDGVYRSNNHSQNGHKKLT